MITPHGPIEAGEIADGSVTADKLAADAVTEEKIAADAVTADKLDIEVLEVTVSSGASTGTATCTEGAIVIGYYPTQNQDQFIDSIHISGTTLTVTLASSATADNKFNVVCLKPTV